MQLEQYGFQLACICSLLFLLATYLFREISNGKRLFIKNKKLFPPGPKGLPLIGSFLTIGDRAHESLAKLAQTYGPLMTLRLGFVNVVKHDTDFMGRPTPDAVTAENGYELTLTWLPPGPQWKKLRKICNTHILSAQTLDSLRDVRHRAMDDMIRRIQEASGAIQIGGLAFATAVQLLSNSLFTTNMLDPRSDAMKELEGKPNLADFFPFLRPFDAQGIRREIKLSYDRLHGLIDDMIDRRMKQRRNYGGSDRCGDILDILLDYTGDQGPQGLTHLDIKLLITDVFIGGTDTSSTTVEWVLAELLHYPTILSKLKRELSEKVIPGKPIQEQDIPRLAYLTAVIKETMRLHPVAPLLLPRRTEQDVVIQGYTIPKHTRVWVNFWSMTRDPTYWDEPARFVPERFLNSDDVGFRGSSDFSFVPFGAGRRVCPGLNLAVRMVSLIVATLVREFDWKLPDGMEPEDMDMTDKFGVTLRKAQPLSAIPIRITR
ncbi:geraniol 8-hydroxylase [Phtheirospermum japonicum]|uniref:Geraniol 8-hydroxylase n=1 Tax=Phtheirospermum japonicum TaxID=374723 RepID=A0A830CI63_9LAMI|nr:geraniol 8-hydroxylase [Phtheirospermum japonicum]